MLYTFIDLEFLCINKLFLDMKFSWQRWSQISWTLLLNKTLYDNRKNIKYQRYDMIWDLFLHSSGQTFAMHGVMWWKLKFISFCFDNIVTAHIILCPRLIIKSTLANAWCHIVLWISLQNGYYLQSEKVCTSVAKAWLQLTNQMKSLNNKITIWKVSQWRKCLGNKPVPALAACC